MKLFRKFWNDDDGFIISTEMLFICVTLVIGLVAGFTALRQGVVTEMAAVGNAVANLNEGYTINGLSSPGGTSESTSVTHTPATSMTISINPPTGQPPATTPPASGGGPPVIPQIASP